jgi:hypothetical protein
VDEMKGQDPAAGTAAGVAAAEDPNRVKSHIDNELEEY